MKRVSKISLDELKDMSIKMFGTLVKADVDVKRGIIVVDGELHADMEAYMLENGSTQDDLWGINLYPDKFGTDQFIEFDSMINIRPRQNNNSRYVENESIRKQIIKIVDGVVHV